MPRLDLEQRLVATWVLLAAGLSVSVLPNLAYSAILDSLYLPSCKLDRNIVSRTLNKEVVGRA